MSVHRITANIRCWVRSNYWIKGLKSRLCFDVLWINIRCTSRFETEYPLEVGDKHMLTIVFVYMHVSTCRYRRTFGMTSGCWNCCLLQRLINVGQSTFSVFFSTWIALSFICNAGSARHDLSPVHTSNNVETTLSKQQATLLPVASTMLPFWATLSKQRSTLSRGRNFNAKLVRRCCRFWQQSRTLLRHCCWCGPGFSGRMSDTCRLRIQLPTWFTAEKFAVARFLHSAVCSDQYQYASV